MLFHSTRGQDSNKTFEEVLMQGLASDGGLFMPDHWPQVDIEELKHLQPIYVSKDGEYFIYGDMYKISGNKVLNITNNEIKSRRLDIINKMAKDEFIEFRSNNEKYLLTVFTDVDCGYCRKLHNEMSEYNELGISIRYAAFPRSGIGTQAFTKMVGAWCSSDPKKSITDLKKI